MIGQNSRFWRAVAQCFLICIALVVATSVSFQFKLTLATAAFAYLVIIVLLSLMGNFLISAGVSFAAVGCLAYYFAPPIFSLQVSDRFDDVAIILFLTTSGIITQLVSRLRTRTQLLALTNAQLEAQIAERKQTQESLQQAQANLERVNRVMLVGEMTASIAHELNQPLTGVITNAGTSLRWLAAQPPDVVEARQYLGLVVTDGRRASEVIDRIRELVKNGPPRADRVDINEAILEVIALTRGELQRNRNPVELRTQLATNLPPVHADRVQLQQVILNLIANANEAMSTVSDGPRELVIGSSRSETSSVLVEVRDSGPGFDPASLDSLFQSFYTTKPDGIGMGLSISRSIVESHGGRVWATPNEPHGAVFRFSLPLEGDNAIAFGAEADA